MCKKCGTEINASPELVRLLKIRDALSILNTENYQIRRTGLLDNIESVNSEIERLVS